MTKCLLKETMKSIKYNVLWSIFSFLITNVKNFSFEKLKCSSHYNKTFLKKLIETKDD